MAIRKINESTLTAIGNAIRSKTGGSALINPEDMADEIDSISTGATITDGTVVLDRTYTGDDNLQRPLKIVHYGTNVYNNMYATGGNNDGFRYYITEEISFHDAVTRIGKSAFSSFGARASACNLAIPSTVTEIGENAFRGSGIRHADIPSSITTLPKWCFCDCSNLVSINAPSVTSLVGTSATSTAITGTLNSLESITLGSVGTTFTSCASYGINCANSGLTITVYTIGSYIDTLISNIRNRATNATIIFKASEATTYNGTTYAAGDTILTSEVTS